MIIEDDTSFRIVKGNYNLVMKIFDLLHNVYDKINVVDQRFKTSLLLFLANLSYHENSFDFFETFLNIEEFFSKFRVTFYLLSNQLDRELLLVILINLTYIKEIQLIVPKYPKTLKLILELFTSNDEPILRRGIQLLANLSIN